MNIDPFIQFIKYSNNYLLFQRFSGENCRRPTTNEMSLSHRATSNTGFGIFKYTSGYSMAGQKIGKLKTLLNKI